MFIARYELNLNIFQVNLRLQRLEITLVEL